MNLLSLGAGVQSTKLLVESLEEGLAGFWRYGDWWIEKSAYQDIQAKAKLGIKWDSWDFPTLEEIFGPEVIRPYRGEIPLFDGAIFADTGAEPDAVYRHLEWCEELSDGRIPIYRVSDGNIEEDTLGAAAGELTRLSTAPFYAKNDKPYTVQIPIYAEEVEDGQFVQGTEILRYEERTLPPDTGGMLFRQCTRDYKLTPIRRKVRELWRLHGKPHIYQYIGISLDEQTRMKDSGVQFITNVYHLVEKRQTRDDCLVWLEVRGHPRPPKSACYMCPFRSNKGWLEQKRDDPKSHERAISFDRKLREGRLPGVTGKVYVHRSFIPLSEVVYKDEPDLDRQLGFENECEGMCGV